MNTGFNVVVFTVAAVALGGCDKGSADSPDAWADASEVGKSGDAKAEDSAGFGVCPPRDDSKVLVQASSFPLAVEAHCVGASYSGKGRVKRVSVDQETGHVRAVVVELEGDLMCGEGVPEVTIVGTAARSLPFAVDETLFVELERHNPLRLWMVAKLSDEEHRLRLLFHRAPGPLTMFEQVELGMHLEPECEIPLEALAQTMCFNRPVLLSSIRVNGVRFGRDENALIRTGDQQLRMVNVVEWEWREAIPGACNPRHTAPEGMFIDFHLVKEE